jgi:hypothetical protein
MAIDCRWPDLITTKQESGQLFFEGFALPTSMQTPFLRERYPHTDTFFGGVHAQSLGPIFCWREICFVL